jgi:hypothetical protein
MTSLYNNNNNNMGLMKTTLASSFGVVFDLCRIPRQFLYHRAHGPMDKSPLKSRADEQQVETRVSNTSQWLWCGSVCTTNTGRLSGGSTVVPRRTSGKSWLMTASTTAPPVYILIYRNECGWKSSRNHYMRMDGSVAKDGVGCRVRAA